VTRLRPQGSDHWNLIESFIARPTKWLQDRDNTAPNSSKQVYCFPRERKYLTQTQYEFDARSLSNVNTMMTIYDIAHVFAILPT